MTLYPCIAADPPWFESGGGKIKRGADRHYPLMRWGDILTLMRNVLQDKVAESAHLWMWATDNHLLEASCVMQGLGFRFVRQFVWVKTKSPYDAEDNAVVDALTEDDLQLGLGQYSRGAYEPCLFGVRGKAMVPPPERRPKSVIFAPRSQHSRKPDKAFTHWFEQVSPGPRLEMFARSARDGWDRWGNEAPQ